MKQITIIVTENNVLLEYQSSKGPLTQQRNYLQYNSQFNFGYNGGGPLTLAVALMEILHGQGIEEIQPQNKGYREKPGYNIIEQVVQFGDWQKPLEQAVSGYYN